MELTLESPAPLKLDSLDLVIPLRPAYAQFFHHSSTLPVYVWDWPKKQLNAGRVGARAQAAVCVFHLARQRRGRLASVLRERQGAFARGAHDGGHGFAGPGGVRATVPFALQLHSERLVALDIWLHGDSGETVSTGLSSLRYCQMGSYGIEDHSWDNKPPAEGHPPALDLLKASGVNCVGFHEDWSEQQSLPRPKDPARLVSLIDVPQARNGPVLYTGCWADMTSPEFTNRWEMLPLADHYQYQRPDNGHICRACCNGSGYREGLNSSYRAALAQWNSMASTSTGRLRRCLA